MFHPEIGGIVNRKTAGNYIFSSGTTFKLRFGEISLFNYFSVLHNLTIKIHFQRFPVAHKREISANPNIPLNILDSLEEGSKIKTFIPDSQIHPIGIFWIDTTQNHPILPVNYPITVLVLK